MDFLREAHLSTPLALVGTMWAFTYVYSFVRLLFSVFILPGKSLRSFGPPGSWALVTGASDGIGLEFATQLARAKFNVLLVSRTQSKLDTLAASLSSTHGVETATLAFDFESPTAASWQALAKQISGRDIAVLINNVGRSHSIPVTFAETPAAEMRAIIDINVTGTLNVTSLVLPGMRSRKRGLILTMGSFGGLLPTPLLATYSGSKAFLQQWSSALGAELEPEGITVQLVQSYLVTSAMSKIRRSSATVPTPRAFVRSVLGKIGRSGGAQAFAHSSTPWWSHAVMQWGMGLVGFTGDLMLGVNKNMHEKIRKRALRKAEREAKAQ